MSEVMTVKEAMAEYRMCRQTLMKSAGEAGAIFKMGRTMRIIVPKMNAYLSDIAEETSATAKARYKGYEDRDRERKAARG